jgi:hypothetical protein
MRVLLLDSTAAFSARIPFSPTELGSSAMSSADTVEPDASMGTRDIPLTVLRNHRVLGLEEPQVIVWLCMVDWWGIPSWTDYSAMEVAELERGFVNEVPVVLLGTWPNHEFHLVGIPGGLCWTQFSLRTGKHRGLRRSYVTAGQ